MRRLIVILVSIVCVVGFAQQSEQLRQINAATAALVGALKGALGVDPEFQYIPGRIGLVIMMSDPFPKRSAQEVARQIVVLLTALSPTVNELRNTELIIVAYRGGYDDKADEIVVMMNKGVANSTQVFINGRVVAP